MIELKNMSVSYEETKILTDINLSVSTGECLVLCGPSGCGKSTLIRVLSGLAPELYPATIEGDGKVGTLFLPTDHFTQYVQQLGVVFQNPKTQFFTNDVYSELAFSMENQGVERQTMIETIDYASQEFGLTSLLNKSMFHLSGGEKQRVAFASASILKQPLLLLDEPSSNLDEAAIHQIKEYLYMVKQQGVTIVIAEHRLHYLMDVADRFVLMTEGTIKKTLTRADMLALTSEQLHDLDLRETRNTPLSLCSDPVNVPVMTTIDLERVTYQERKGTRKINIDHLTIDNQGITGIIGPNGSGKTTLSHVLTGLIKKRKGIITINGKKMTPRQLVECSFLVMQDVNLQLFFETVEKELITYAKRLDLLDSVIHQLNLESLLWRHPKTLSGGEKQRVAIGSAILSGKEMIIFDEPTSGLDLKHMEEVSHLLKWLNELGVLVIVITHDKEFIKKTCHKVINLNAGSVI